MINLFYFKKLLGGGKSYKFQFYLRGILDIIAPNKNSLREVN